MAAPKFTEAEREKLFAQLEAPFDPALIKWRVMRTSADGRSGVILPFADPRAYPSIAAAGLRAPGDCG
jgi:hypothetical protein